MRVRDLSKTPIVALAEAQAKAEPGRLAAEIAEHDRSYYQEDRPTISDAAYDALRQRNAAIKRRFPAQLDASIAASRPLGVFAHAWGEMSAMPAGTQSGMIKWFARCGFGE
jgi:NAD-dependent DNA ligase